VTSKTAVIGFGNIAKAIITPLFDKKLLNPKDIYCLVNTKKSLENIRKNYKYDINIFQANSKGSEIIWDCKVKLLSVKPQQLKNIIELEKNKNKSERDIKDFTERYSTYVKKTEPNTLGWSYNDAGDKIILIERYKNEGAIFNHINNVSPEGVLEKDFGQFMDHFVIDSITYYGDLTKEFKSTISEFGMKTIYFKNISGFSK
jgi:hypothetical protein